MRFQHFFRLIAQFYTLNLILFYLDHNINECQPSLAIIYSFFVSNCKKCGICISIPTKPIFFSESAIVGARANNFQQYSKHSFRKFDKFVEIRHLLHLNTELV